MSVSYIYHKGKKIMYVDYSHCKNVQEMIQVLEEVKKEYEKTTENYIAVADFRGNFGSSEFMQRAKKIGQEILDKRTRKTAILGVSGIKKILLNGYNAFVTHKLVPFDSKEEALDYLVKD